MNREPIDHRTPVDFLEPEESKNEIREAGLAAIRIMSLALSFVVTAKDSLAAAYGVVFALGLSTVTDKSMREIGRELNLSSGTISNYAKAFRRLAGLPPSLLQRDLETADSAREARLKNLQ